MLIMNKTDLSTKPLCQAQADDFLYDQHDIRIWRCRVTKDYSAEYLTLDGKWISLKTVETLDSVHTYN